MATPLLLLRVAATWPLPGLGLLVLPQGPTPHLAAYPLHTALRVRAHLPDGSRHEATATVEEVTREAELVQGLLLDTQALVSVPAGTEIWLLTTETVDSELL
jgi:hypothetical protein